MTIVEDQDYVVLFARAPRYVEITDSNIRSQLNFLSIVITVCVRIEISFDNSMGREVNTMNANIIAKMFRIIINIIVYARSQKLTMNNIIIYVGTSVRI